MTRRSVVLLSLSVASTAFAATSPNAAPSPFGGNGHNVSFDGRLFIAARSYGWEATVLRPQAATPANGFVDMSQAFAPSVLVQPTQYNENALALCEETPQPYRCTQGGAPDANGAYDCYDEVIFDSDAVSPAPANVMRRRKMRVVVSNPGTANAEIHSFTWLQATPVNLTNTLRGIEPSVTRDGKLMVWQGYPSNNGDIDTIVYSVNSQPCAATGWTTPKSITAMYTDPLVSGKYKLAEKPLRGADGTIFTASQVIRGGYPWVFPDGEAVNFTATLMPCKIQPPNEMPPGCGPRRNAISFIGYPTNWQLAHVDGAINPDTDATVRLFFSSPGPLTFNGMLPVTPGLDVWPFFGTNTSNYTEVVFDDGLDGRYGGLWHFNELVDNLGKFDLTRTADSSGYSNTGKLVGGATYPPQNNGALGKAIVFNGTTGRVEVPHASSLNPVNAITVELWVKLASDPDCDGNNNYRMLLGKGNITGSYSLVLEQNRDLQFRLRMAGGAQYAIPAFTQLPIGVWTHVAVQYEAASGEMNFLVNGVETNRVTHPPALIAGVNDKLTIGGPDGARAACPNGDGQFHGELDEVAISRIWRYGTPPTVVDAGTPMMDAGVPEADAGATMPPADAGSPTVDAGNPVMDAGMMGGLPDAGSMMPAPDAGAPPQMAQGPSDAGATEEPRNRGVIGVQSCSSTTGGGAVLWVLFALAGVLALTRRAMRG